MTRCEGCSQCEATCHGPMGYGCDVCCGHDGAGEERCSPLMTCPDCNNGVVELFFSTRACETCSGKGHLIKTEQDCGIAKVVTVQLLNHFGKVFSNPEFNNIPLPTDRINEYGKAPIRVYNPFYYDYHVPGFVIKEIGFERRFHPVEKMWNRCERQFILDVTGSGIDGH